MSKALFQGLKKIGVDETTAYEVSGAMNPERYATRQDLVEAIGAIDKSIAAHREETQKSISAIHTSISAHREETQKNISAMREETQKNMSAMRDSIAVHREDTQKNISAHREETQKNLVTSNRQLWVFFSTIIVTLIALLISTWHRQSQPVYSVSGSIELKQPTPAKFPKAAANNDSGSE